jgi:hypothetical protein
MGEEINAHEILSSALPYIPSSKSGPTVAPILSELIILE